MNRDKSAAKAIPEILQNYATSVMAGNPDQWILNWTEDCAQLPPGGPMVVGKKNLFDSMSAWFETYSVADLGPLGDLEIQDAGDWAYATGQFSYRLTPRDGRSSFVFEGKFLSIFERQSDGTWLMHRDCYNSSTPDH